MRRFLGLAYLALMAALVLSLSGCGGSSDSGLGSSSGTDTVSDDITTDSGDISGEETSGTAYVIVLNGSSATIDGSAVTAYDYVWHSDPDHADEYFTNGSASTTELTEEQVLSVIGDARVYIARDIRYMTSSLDFTAAVKDDDETEYAAYYSDAVQAEIAAKYAGSPDMAGPYIFATLPGSMGMGGAPGGTGGTGSGGGIGTTPPERRSMGVRSAASYNDTIASTIAAMTHSASEAYSNPVLHISKPGTYRISGTWHGQIWIDAGDGAESDKVTVILDGVTVSCDVAPALVFYKNLYECGPDDETEAASEWKTLGLDVKDKAGAKVVITDGTVNTFSGTNVYRMLKPQPKKDSVTKIDGTDISQQKKRYKMDAAFYSYVSMAVSGGTSGTGQLNITSTYEGLDAELHMVITGGKVTVSAADDGINVNEDDISVFDLEDGTLTITSQNGDGIDSNGYAVVNGGTLNITAGSQKQNSAGEAGIDAEKGTYIATEAAYNWTAISGTGGR